MIQKMDLCIYTWFGFRYSFDEIIKLIKNAGFQSVMTWWGDEFIETDGQPKEKRPEIIRKNDLRLENVHFPFSDINEIWIDSLEGQELINKFIEYISEYKTYEIPTAVMHISNGDNPPPFNQLGLDRFKKIIDKAEKENINIALENLRKPEYLDFIYSNIKSDKLKFCYDSGHENCFTPNYNYLDKYKNKLIALHLHDNDGTKDQHLLPFNGTINWKNLMDQIKNIEYKGSLALEIVAQYIDISKKYVAEEYLNEAKNRANKLMEI
jgi:sugar phosphate isomerase/epimerase